MVVRLTVSALMVACVLCPAQDARKAQPNPALAFAGYQYTLDTIVFAGHGRAMRHDSLVRGLSRVRVLAHPSVRFGVDTAGTELSAIGIQGGNRTHVRCRAHADSIICDPHSMYGTKAMTAVLDHYYYRMLDTATYRYANDTLWLRTKLGDTLVLVAKGDSTKAK